MAAAFSIAVRQASQHTILMLLTSYFPNPDPVRSALLAWYRKAKRDLPWRRDCTPYRVWISEIMLQQTQMSRGTAFFERWMRRFPDLQSLAAASEEEVLRAWEGLGYYSRARNILKAARLIAERGSFPCTVQDLLKLPGIGTYTASAIASIACNADTACVDANVERVLSRLCDLDLPIRSKEGKTLLAELAQDFLTEGRAGEHNQAMMELGALICGKNPLCQNCPLGSWCLARKNGTVHMRPVLPEPSKRIPLDLVSTIVILDEHLLDTHLHEGHPPRHYYDGHSGGHLLLHPPCQASLYQKTLSQPLLCVTRRPPGSVWGGLWAFPDGKPMDGEPYEKAALRIAQKATGLSLRLVKALATLKTAYTKYNVTSHFYLLCPNKLPDGHSAILSATSSAAADACTEAGTDTAASALRWIAAEELPTLPMPPLHKKAARLLWN